MISYQQPFGLPLTEGLGIEPFGIIVAVGVLLGVAICQRRADQLGFDYDEFRTYLFWYIIFAGFMGAHVLDVLFYKPHVLAEDPLELIKVWKGISSYGGFVGGTLGFAAYFFVRRKRQINALAWADTTMLGLIVAFTIGRIGCTVVLDHPGKPGLFSDKIADFPWVHEFYSFGLDPTWAGYEYAKCTTEEGMRICTVQVLNLGLYEFIYLALVTLILGILLWRRRWPHGFILGYMASAYAPVRFFLDYLRPSNSDPRYLGLTFAQWTSVATLVAGIAVLVYAFKKAKGDYPPRFFFDKFGVENEDANDEDIKDKAKPSKKDTSKGAARDKAKPASKNKKAGNKKKKKKR